jgi:hypothetical protein
MPLSDLRIGHVQIPKRFLRGGRIWQYWLWRVVCLDGILAKALPRPKDGGGRDGGQRPKVKITFHINSIV